MPESRLTTRQRQQVMARAPGCCEYCYTQARFSADPLVVEHILPRSLGGRTESSNLAAACMGCNGHKYNRTQAIDPLTLQPEPLFHPRRQAWHAHFAWNEDCSLILGLTPTGRATVEALHLNRPGLITVRRLLYAAGEHPPVFDEGAMP